MVIRVAQCNIRSLNTSSKLIEDVCQIQEIGVLSLTEIWHPEVSNLKFLQKWTWHASTRNNREGGGAATIINPQIKTHPRKDLNNPLLEMVWCEIYAEKRKILIGTVYIPPGHDDEMRLLTETLEKISSQHDNVIVMGDFNARHPMWYNEDSNKLGDQLCSYLSTSNYTLANNNMHTYKKSIIDLTLVKGCTNLVTNWSAHPEIMVNTDHIMIMYDINLRVNQREKTKWNIKKVNWEEWKNRTKTSFEDIMNNIRETESVDINRDYLEFRDCIIKLGEENIGKTKGWSQCKPWWNEEIGKKYEIYKKARKDMKKRSDHQKLEKFSEARSNFLESYQKSKQNYLETTIRSLDGDERNMWKAVKRFNNAADSYVIQPLTDDCGNILSNDDEIANEFEKQYGEAKVMVDSEILQDIKLQAEEMITKCDTEGESDVINGEITKDEIRKSIMKMRDDTGYNPIENIDSRMLKRSDDTIYDLLHYLYNTWFLEGDIPLETKIDYKKLHKKPNKSTYNKWKSYRPISLESLISKCFLRILRERVDWKIETVKGFAFTQEAYRKDRSPNDILTRLVQSIQEAWLNGETVVLAIVDYESFFENIWHDLLVVKLHKLGIKGKILKTLYNHLKDRKHCFEVNGFVSELKTSNIGTPQGGTTSTTSANVYTFDSDTSFYELHAEFSDDNLKWEHHLDENLAVMNLQERLNQYFLWCKKNNIKLSADKCRIMIFRPKASPRPYNQPKIHIGNEEIDVVEEKRILGTILDTELNFDAHFSFVEKACYAAFHTVKHLYTGNLKPSVYSGTMLYKTLIRSIMEYSTVAIANINEKQLSKMQSIQHKCLKLVTQTLASSSREVLNVMTSTLPIDLHFKLRVSESLARIMSKSSPINKSYKRWSGSEERRKYTKSTTTYRKMELATQQLLKKNIRQHQVLEVELYDDKFPPFVQTSGIIPSKNSKEEQKDFVASLLRSNEFDYIISTDGSTLKEDSRSSLGQSGAAAVVFRKENMRDPLHVETKSLGLTSHNYEAELIGLQLALQLLVNKGVNNKKVLVVCDCIPAMESTFTNKITVDYNNTIISNKNLLHNLKTIHQNTIVAVWAPGHEGILINEMADIIAKEEAAKQIRNLRPLERKIVLTSLKQEVLSNWQRRVDNELANHQITEVNSMVKSWKIYNINGSKHLTRLATGHHFLNSFQSKINLKTPKNCSCGQIETMHHYFFLCQKYVRFRQKWHHRVAGITEDLDVLNQMTLATAFGQRTDL